MAKYIVKFEFSPPIKNTPIRVFTPTTKSQSGVIRLYVISLSCLYLTQDQRL